MNAALIDIGIRADTRKAIAEGPPRLFADTCARRLKTSGQRNRTEQFTNRRHC